VRRRRLAVAALATVAVEAVAVWARSGRFGGNIVVRCRRGHLYTTIWIPGASIKSARLGLWRVQYCPVGHHWSIVVPVRESELSAEELATAAEEHDLPVP
jgi:hypothetical protein